MKTILTTAILLANGNPDYYTVGVNYNKNISVVYNKQYKTYFNNKLQSPELVVEILEPADFTGSDNRDNLSFKQDNRVNSHKPQKFNKIGYDRGHLSAAANTTNFETIKESFLMSNIAAQTPALNRGPWRELEEYTRSVASKERVEVITGVIYNCVDSKEINGVKIPEKFFKTLKTKEGIRMWIIPNTHNPQNFEHYEINYNTIVSVKLCDLKWKW